MPPPRPSIGEHQQKKQKHDQRSLKQPGHHLLSPVDEQKQQRRATSDSPHTSSRLSGSHRRSYLSFDYASRGSNGGHSSVVSSSAPTTPMGQRDSERRRSSRKVSFDLNSNNAHNIVSEEQAFRDSLRHSLRQRASIEAPTGLVIPMEGDGLLRDDSRSVSPRLSKAALSRVPVNSLFRIFRSVVRGTLGKDPVRWWVLIVFCIVSFANALVSLTFSSYPLEAMVLYPGLSKDGVNLLLFWSSIIPVVFMLPAMLILTMKAGLKYCIQLGAFLTLLGSFVRYIPTMLGPTFVTSQPDAAILLLHGGQVLNAMAFPLFMASPTQLSSTWFPAHQRTTVTAVSAIFCEIGYAFAFFIPSFAPSLPEVLLQELNLCLMGFVSSLSLFFLPNHPDRRQPSMASLVTLAIETAEERASPIAELREEVAAAVAKPSFMLLAVLVGVASGVWTGWCPVIPRIMIPHFTEREVRVRALRSGSYRRTISRSL